MGSWSSPTRDQVSVDGNPVHRPPHAYYAVNKPRGYLSAVTDRSRRPPVTALLPRELAGRLAPVGRLDLDSRGLSSSPTTASSASACSTRATTSTRSTRSPSAAHAHRAHGGMTRGDRARRAPRRARRGRASSNATDGRGAPPGIVLRQGGSDSCARSLAVVPRHRPVAACASARSAWGLGPGARPLDEAEVAALPGREARLGRSPHPWSSRSTVPRPRASRPVGRMLACRTRPAAGRQRPDVPGDHRPRQ